MPYSQRSDLNLDERRIIELTDSEVAVGVADEDLIEREHYAASGIVDSHLYGRYATPVIGTIPPLLKRLEAALWRMGLYRHRENIETPRAVAEEHAWAMQMLGQIAAGEFPLPIAPVSGATESDASGGSFSSDSDDRLFGRAKDLVG